MRFAFRNGRIGHCTTRALGSCLALLSLAVSVSAQQTFRCPNNGEIRIRMDPREVAIRYEGTSLAAAIAKLGLFSSTLSFGTTQLQQASAATQQWNQLILGLVMGWNSCAISREQYAEGLLENYPRLKEDAQEFNQIAARLSRGQTIDESRLWTLLTSYVGKIRKLAELNGNGAYEVLIQTKTNTDQILTEVREMRKSCGEYRIPFFSATYPSLSATTGSAFREDVSESLTVTDSVQTTLFRVGPTNQLTGTIAGAPLDLPVLGGGLGTSLPSLDQNASILLTSISSQTGLSGIQLDREGTASLLAWNGSGNMPSLPVLGGGLGTSLSSLDQNASILLTSISSQTGLSGIHSETILGLPAGVTSGLTTFGTKSPDSDSLLPWKQVERTSAPCGTALDLHNGVVTMPEPWVGAQVVQREQ
jgi:hypothetical protein